MIPKPVIIGLGNELFADDGWGIAVARRLSGVIGDAADVVECGAAGLSLLDPLAGRPFAIILDAVCTGREAPGTLYRASPADLRTITNLSPHHAGLPEVIAMAKRLKLPVPDDIEIIAVEAEDIVTMGGDLTGRVADSLDPAVGLAVDLLETRRYGGGGVRCVELCSTTSLRF